MLLIDENKLSYTTLERIARDYGYDDDVDQVIEKMEEDTEKFVKEVGKQVIKIIKGEQ